jgi:hypothetical protein
LKIDVLYVDRGRAETRVEKWFLGKTASFIGKIIIFVDTHKRKW